jgi:hypothetical protein
MPQRADICDGNPKAELLSGMPISPPMSIESDDEPTIAAIADEFSVPVQEVSAIYTGERRRLERGARIKNFLTVLAIGNTRSILRDLGRTHDGRTHDYIAA